MDIIWDNSPHLGGRGVSAEDRVIKFNAIQRESNVNFYACTVNIYSQLELLQDHTYQKKNIIGKFITIPTMQRHYSIKAAMQLYIYDDVKLSDISLYTTVTLATTMGTTPNNISAIHTKFPAPSANNTNIRLDADGMCDMQRHLLNHTLDSCPLVGAQSLRVKDTQEALVHHNTKNPPPKTKPSTDIPRCTPIRPILLKQPVAKKLDSQQHWRIKRMIKDSRL
eukprot:770928-Ditylum_brightwellii.AAC.1